MGSWIREQSVISLEKSITFLKKQFINLQQVCQPYKISSRISIPGWNFFFFEHLYLLKMQWVGRLCEALLGLQTQSVVLYSQILAGISRTIPPRYVAATQGNWYSCSSQWWWQQAFSQDFCSQKVFVVCLIWCLNQIFFRSEMWNQLCGFNLVGSDRTLTWSFVYLLIFHTFSYACLQLLQLNIPF